MSSAGEETTTKTTTRKPAKVYPHLQQQQNNPQFQDSPNSSNPSFNNDSRLTINTGGSSSPASDASPFSQPAGGQLLAPQAAYRRNSRPTSQYSLAPDSRGRSPGAEPRLRAVSGHSYDSRRSSYMDLTQPAHTQEEHHRPVSSFDNSYLQSQVGAFASRMSARQTLEMYRANAKKTQDPMLQYNLAVFMVQLAQQQSAEGTSAPESPGLRKMSAASDSATPSGTPTTPAVTRKELLKEARETLERIQSKLPQAQYYLADAYSSGLFNKGREENEKAFPLFVAASKHGHAEAGYRAALCYEFGWGCRKDPLKAVQFFRQAASKSHPGAMTRLGIACLRSDLGLHDRYREGLKWLKRATEVADEQYPSAPYELGLLHESGYGESVLPDPAYSAQLFTQAAELGHADSNFRMGEAYEHGRLSCPRDPALSVHFYTGAAQRGHPMAMMALCAWYLVGAEPVLEKNEAEAYAWAKQACDFGLPKAEYAIGYFTEMGIGCRRDPLEANVWYVKAASHGDERAVARLKVINEAAGGGGGGGKKARKLEKEKEKEKEKDKDKEKEGKDGKDGKEGKEGKEGKGDCCIM
ncbi:hypothetical protein BZA05DRAFT_344594 [Tricharina praecox]|uniref:uncharacterized protein n=1 Tax=Tricharina praecox TaxID=43433 RepID=UPI0022209947|nr:uncharacterized protein BZA05DRAFT_344594 [Tricharina praecox]KAI5842086.1 hypothetical protein BZA05DRAFT_344594 [Tricharina praecox]